jgi:integrase
LNLREEVVEQAAKAVRARRERARKKGAKIEAANIALDGHASGNRFLAHLAAALAAATEEGLIASNVAKGIRPLPEAPPRSRVLDDQEMQRLVSALGSEDIFTSTAIFTLLETGVRSSELLAAKWSDFDFEAGAWRIASPKAGKPQAVALAGVTIERLKRLQKLGVSPYVIPAKSDPEKPRYDLTADWARVRAKARLEGVNAHDLRRSFGLAVARSAGIHMASKLLRNDVRVAAKIYAPLGLDLQHEAVEARAKLLVFPAEKKAAK